MTPAKKVLGVAVSTAILALPALGCAWTAYQLGIDSLRSLAWTPTPATVMQAGMHKHVTTGIKNRTGPTPDIVTYEPWAVYEYTVNGRKYSSDRVSTSRVFVAEGKGSSAWETREALVKAKQTRQPYTVYVNPGDPAEVVASRALHTTPFLVFLFIGLGAAAFYALVIYLILSRRREP
jgi:hypothetical protein